MKSKKITALVLGLALVAVCAVGAVTAFSADLGVQADEPIVAEQETTPVEEPTVAEEEPAPVEEPTVAEEEPAPVEEPTVAEEEPAPVQEPAPKTKDKSLKKGKSGKGSMTFVGIDAVAAEVLGVSERSLAGLNHADQLYAELVEAGKLDEFKTALIAAKQSQYDAKAALGKFSAEALEEKLIGYIQVIDDWDGTTELVVSSSKTKFK